MTSPISKTDSTAVPGPIGQHPGAELPCGDARIARLIDEHRELVALAAGKQMEICVILGDRDGAQRARKEMEAQVVARIATRETGCFFVAQGDLDRQAAQGRTN